MLKIVSRVCLALCQVLPASAAIHKVPQDEPVATLNVPDKWRTTTHGEFIEADSPDGTVHFLAVHPEGRKIMESMGETMTYIRNKAGLFVDASSLMDEPGKLNGMNVRNVSWKAKEKDTPVIVRFQLLALPGGKHLILAFWMSAKAETKHARELKEIQQSIKAL